jgi:1-acyl-sn-glycerol-3-phosphate acyltransferase
MRDQVIDAPPPRFWPPKPNRFWRTALGPVRWYILHRHAHVEDVQVRGMDELSSTVGPGDGLLICPNHSHLADGAVMMHVSALAWRPFHIMAARHLFRRRWGIDGWVLQRMGVFSIDREGCDRRAIRQAIELLAGGKSLVVFPEGEIYHLNERLTPLREGVAFMAASAQRDLDKSGSAARVWIAPTAVRYELLDDVRPALAAAMTRMEERLVMKPRHDMPLDRRIIAFGEVLLTIKEKEYLGRSFEGDGGDLPARIGRLTRHVLSRHEERYLGRVSEEGEITPVRVKTLRHKLLAECDDTGAASLPPDARDALRDAHFALQLFAYPGDYVSSQPTPERMAETVEKYEEDFFGGARPVGRRRATVTFGPPIDVEAAAGDSRPRTLATDLTARLESDLRRLMAGGQPEPNEATADR